jgi:hypothetical protein
MAEKDRLSPAKYREKYKKYHSSPAAKKKRAELNKYNRDKGTYGNGDGKDASHKGGKIVGFESAKKNRGRTGEKSRTKGEKHNYPKTRKSPTKTTKKAVAKKTTEKKKTTTKKRVVKNK